MNATKPGGRRPRDSRALIPYACRRPREPAGSAPAAGRDLLPYALLASLVSVRASPVCVGRRLTASTIRSVRRTPPEPPLSYNEGGGQKVPPHPPPLVPPLPLGEGWGEGAPPVSPLPCLPLSLCIHPLSPWETNHHPLSPWERVRVRARVPLQWKRPRRRRSSPAHAGTTTGCGPGPSFCRRCVAPASRGASAAGWVGKTNVATPTQVSPWRLPPALPPLGAGLALPASNSRRRPSVASLRGWPPRGVQRGHPLHLGRRAALGDVPPVTKKPPGAGPGGGS